MEKTLEELILKETSQRLKEMASSDYEWPKKIDRRDVSGIIVAIVTCLVLIVLCMKGVIR